MIKAIETKYKGYRFRSRLEARWAVFFDDVGIEWLYEHEGFDINGKYYLPDFYLPVLDVYIEIKGPQYYNEKLLHDFSVELRKPVYLIFNDIPDPDGDDGYLQRVGGGHSDTEAIIWSDDIIDNGLEWGYMDMFMRCDSCGIITIMSNMYETSKGQCRCSESGRQNGLRDSMSKARSERFAA